MQPPRAEPAPAAPGRRLPVAPGLLVVALFLAGLDLRAPIASVPPLVTRISRDLGLGGVAAGLLTALPVLCMGLFAPAAQRLAARVGREHTLVAALSALTAGTALRLGGTAVPLLYLGTFLAGLGIATAGIALPGVVKEYFPGRAGAATGLYLVAMAVGATVASGGSVPLADASGSWPVALAVWAVPAATALVIWWAIARRHAETREPLPPRLPLPWRSRTAQLICAYLAIQSVLFYSQLAWIPPAYENRGWSAARAGLLLSVFNVTQLLAGLLIPAWSDRLRDRRPLFGAVVSCSLAGMATLVLAPEFAPWAAMAVLGFGQGGGFGLGLVLLVSYAPDPAASSRLSALAFLVAYLVAATGPVLVGATHDATGSFTPAFAVLLVVDALQLALVVRFRPGRVVGD